MKNRSATLELNQNPRAIRRRRVRKGLQQKDLAAAAGISPQHMCGIESGAVSAGIGAIGRLAAVLDCEPADLMSEELIRE